MYITAATQTEIEDWRDNLNMIIAEAKRGVLSQYVKVTPVPTDKKLQDLRNSLAEEESLYNMIITEKAEHYLRSLKGQEGKFLGIKVFKMDFENRVIFGQGTKIIKNYDIDSYKIFDKFLKKSSAHDTPTLFDMIDFKLKARNSIHS